MQVDCYRNIVVGNFWGRNLSRISMFQMPLTKVFSLKFPHVTFTYDRVGAICEHTLSLKSSFPINCQKLSPLKGNTLLNNLIPRCLRHPRIWSWKYLGKSSVVAIICKLRGADPSLRSMKTMSFCFLTAFIQPCSPGYKRNRNIQYWQLPMH